MIIVYKSTMVSTLISFNVNYIEDLSCQLNSLCINLKSCSPKHKGLIDILEGQVVNV